MKMMEKTVSGLIYQSRTSHLVYLRPYLLDILSFTLIPKYAVVTSMVNCGIVRNRCDACFHSIKPL